MKTTIIFPLKALSIGIFSIIIAACGEGDENTETSATPPATSIPTTPIEPNTPVKPPVTSIPATPIEPSTPIIPPSVVLPIEPPAYVPPVVIPPSFIFPIIRPSIIGPAIVSAYPEPQQDILDASSLGFYDHDGREGEPRIIRSDLLGSFQAMIQFGQNHVVDPQGNEAKRMPRLTTEKEALLLVTPTDEMGIVQQLMAEIYKDGVLLRTINLDDPAHIPSTDQNNSDARPRVFYSKRTWSAKLNWNEVQAGLKIRIVDGQNRSGELFEDKIDFAAAGELVLNNIRIGMLTNAPQSGGHYMWLEPEKAGSDYLQTIPAAQMTIGRYDDVKLDRVMISNGTIYDSVSSSTGDIYGGDMRENTAKATFGVGINLANWGVTSASMQSQEQPQVTQSVIAHHARGKYTNGEHNHGLSGGNGMLTLIDSTGNEFSHEIGHHYGLGHYPGEVNGDYFWAEHHANSGWGYNGVRNKMRSNLEWWRDNVGAGKTGKPTFLSTYAYGKDAMSGGSNSGAFSSYTHYTGYSTFFKIQPAFDKYVWASDSSTGYKKWNKDTRKMEVSQPTVPKSNNVWYNRADNNYLKPRLSGVPVFTILGGYDPFTQKGLIYPAARGNWGNVFDLPTANTALNNASCWLKVTYSNANGYELANNIAIAPNRMNGNANKFHINLAIADNPKSVDLYCKKANEAEQLLSSVIIPTYVDTIKPAVTFGRDYGYSALRNIELPRLEQKLIAQSANPIISLDNDAKLLYDSYKANLDELSPMASQVLTRYEQQQSTIHRLNRWVNTYHRDLTDTKVEAIMAFKKFFDVLGLKDDQPLAGVSLMNNQKNCFKVEKLENGKLNTFISGPSGCTGDDSEQWIYDIKGKIHSKLALDQCLTQQGGEVVLNACSLDWGTQVWMMNVGASEIKQNNKCFDLQYGKLTNNRASLITYNCNGGGNQKWTILTKNPSLLLATAGDNLPLIVDSLQKQPVTTDSMETQSLSMDITEEPSVLAKLSNAISTFIEGVFN